MLCAYNAALEASLSDLRREEITEELTDHRSTCKIFVRVKCFVDFGHLLELQGDDVLGHPRPILSVLHIFGEILLLTFISPCSHACYFIFTYLARVLM